MTRFISNNIRTNFIKHELISKTCRPLLLILTLSYDRIGTNVSRNISLMIKLSNLYIIYNCLIFVPFNKPI